MFPHRGLIPGGLAAEVFSTRRRPAAVVLTSPLDGGAVVHEDPLHVHEMKQARAVGPLVEHSGGKGFVGFIHGASDDLPGLVSRGEPL